MDTRPPSQESRDPQLDQRTEALRSLLDEVCEEEAGNEAPDDAEDDLSAGVAASDFPDVYEELRSLAGKIFEGERREHTLQPTALVNEVYLRLCGSGNARWNDQAHFFRVAARAMRRVLVDHARRKRAGKRIPQDELVSLDVDLAQFESATQTDILDLVELLKVLERDERTVVWADMANLHLFGGRTVQEAGQMLKLSESEATVAWRGVRAWLIRRLGV